MKLKKKKFKFVDCVIGVHPVIVYLTVYLIWQGEKGVLSNLERG